MIVFQLLQGYAACPKIYIDSKSCQRICQIFQPATANASHEKKPSYFPLNPDCLKGILQPATANASHEKKPSYFPLNPDCLKGILIIVYCNPHMGLSENRDTPKCMVKIMEKPLKMDDFRGKPPIFGNIHIDSY